MSFRLGGSGSAGRIAALRVRECSSMGPAWLIGCGEFFLELAAGVLVE